MAHSVRLTNAGEAINNMIVHGAMPALMAGKQSDSGDVAEDVRRCPRLSFKRAFNDVLKQEVDHKQPYPHWFHIYPRIAHDGSALTTTDATAVLVAAPFDE